MPTCGLGNVHRAAADLKTDRKTGRKGEKRTEGGKKEKGGRNSRGAQRGVSLWPVELLGGR